MRIFSLMLMAALAGCSARADNGESEDKAWTIAAQLSPTTPAAQSQATYTLTITPKAPWVLKTITPLTVVLTASEGLSLDKTRLDAKDIVDAATGPKAVRTAVTTTSTGKQRIDAEATFFLCTDEICKREQDKVTVTLNVQ